MVSYLPSFGVQCILAVASVLCITLSWSLVPMIWWRLKSPLRKLPAPPSAHWLYGNLGDVYDARKSMHLDEWAETYGPAVRFGGFLNVSSFPPRAAAARRMRITPSIQSPTLFTLDTRALNHILTHCETYQKSVYGRRSLSRILGEGLSLE